MSTPVTISSFLALRENEGSISAWKTKTIIDKGSHYIKITDGSDRNQEFLNRIFKVSRYEFDGDKVVFNTAEIPVFATHQPLSSNERSISAWKTKAVDSNQIKILDGSDGNKDVLNRIFQIIRYEFGGQKIIFDNAPG